MNPVEIEFYELLNSGCPDKLYFKYYLIEAINRLKKMRKKERGKLNIKFEKESSWIKDRLVCKNILKKYYEDFIQFLKDRYEYEVKNELFSNCTHTKKKGENV